MIRFLFSIFLVFISAFWNFSSAQKPCFDKEPTPWADSVFQSLTLDEKIGQLFMIAAWSDPSHKSYDANGVQSLIDKYHIGGLIFMQGSPARQAILTNKYQLSSRV
ncbi:MAG: beta-N-acetylglucosaminidase, partial [Flavobacteriales bacterium]